MAQDYYTILTNAGLAYEAQQKAQNKPITLTHYCVCDGNGAVYNPDPAMTALRREVTPRLPLNALLQDPSNPTWLVAEGLLPDDVGGWTIRALGIYTDTGILYAVSKCSESVKPLLASGGGKQFYVRVIFQTSNAASVTLLVDNSVVMAPRSFVIDHVRDELAKRDHKQSVRVATLGSITLSGEQNIDGLAVVAGDRVLVKDQVSAVANGIYVAALGVWTRATDADSSAKLNSGAIVPVESGATNGASQWMLATDAPIALNTTPLVFEVCGGRPVATKAWVYGNAASAADIRSGVSAGKMVTPSALKALGGESGYSVFAVAGTHAFVVPEILQNGVKKAFVTVEGGGGGAGAHSAGGGGGGGGGLALKLIDLAGVQTVNLVIGIGGSGAIAADTAAGKVGGPGGSSSFGAYVSATGGMGGDAWLGGGAGVGVGGDVNSGTGAGGSPLRHDLQLPPNAVYSGGNGGGPSGGRAHPSTSIGKGGDGGLVSGGAGGSAAGVGYPYGAGGNGGSGRVTIRW